MTRGTARARGQAWPGADTDGAAVRAGHALAAQPCPAFLLRLEDQLRDLDDPGQLARTACGMVAAHLGVAEALLLQLDGQDRLEDFGAAAARLAEGHMLKVMDVRLDPRLTGAAVQAGWAARQVLALAAAPVLLHGQATAILAAAHRQPFIWSDVDLALLRDAGARIWRALGAIAELRRRTRVEAALRSDKERFVRALAGARVGTWEFDIETGLLEASPGFAATFFGRPDGAIRSAADVAALLHPQDRAGTRAAFARAAARARRGCQADHRAEFRILLPNGDVRWLGSLGGSTGDFGSNSGADSGADSGAVSGADPGTGRNARLCGVLVDMSERRRAELELNATRRRLQDLSAGLEAQVRREVLAREQAQAQRAQSQRLEALGQLAGGIAHDFNNVLQGVMGGLELLQRRADRPDQVRQLAARTSGAVDRGVAITGRLLAFARRGELQPERVDAQSLLDGLLDLLGPKLGAGIALNAVSEPGLQAFLADRAQLETVLVDLAVNACRAMPQGGTLSVAARHAAVHAGAPLQAGMPPGLGAGGYVQISMQDTGTGMTAEVLGRACEPFFTTKPAGQGTGLGLAMARGFVEQSGGGLMLSSQPGRGTTVSIWLPAVQAARPPGSAAPPAGARLDGRPPCVLVVDDDGLVRSTLAGLLVDLGCTVIEAEGGASALAYLRAGVPVDLVLTDSSMPASDGAALAAVAGQNHPGLALLLITGNVDALPAAVGWDPARIMVLRKPCSAGSLADAVANLLGTCSRA